MNAKNEDGSYKHPESPSVEVQHAIKVFGSIQYVFELQGTKRLKAGDPLVDFLECMRHGKRFPEPIWRAIEKTIAGDRHGVLDRRHRTAKFALRYGLSMYWETLSRSISRRSRRDARELGLLLVRSAAQRFLNISNMHSTGHIHGVMPAHVGMRVSIAVKVNSTLGLVQEQRARRRTERVTIAVSSYHTLAGLPERVA